MRQGEDSQDPSILSGIAPKLEMVLQLGPGGRGSPCVLGHTSLEWSFHLAGPGQEREEMRLVQTP